MRALRSWRGVAAACAVRATFSALAMLSALTAGACGFALPASSVATDGAIDWHAEPVQVETRRAPFLWPEAGDGVLVRPRASFDISAVVAAAEPYSIDAGAFLAPVDLVMTWGRLPEEPFRSRVSYYQMARFYYWHTRDAGLDRRYIETHSANMHMVPSDVNLRRALAHLGSGDRVRIRGLLVDIEAPRLRWHTSMTREDTGPGACELVWVEEIQRGDRLYL
jgi:hypothetical protein